MTNDFTKKLDEEIRKQQRNPHNPSDIQNTSMTNIECGLDSGLVKVLVHDSNYNLQLCGFSQEQQYQIDGTWDYNFPFIIKHLQDYRIIIENTMCVPQNKPRGVILSLKSQNPKDVLHKVCNILHQEYNRPPHGAVF
tara:strand:+ start:464 stop:874 length:411 start_codon:yes stop_codon:yes gene_type:complete